MAFAAHRILLAVVLTHGSVAGFSTQRFGALRPRAALHPAQQPRTVVASGAIDLAANATKGLVEGVVRTVTDNDEYQFGDLTKGVVRDLTGKDASEYWNELHAHLKEDILEDILEGEPINTGLEDLPTLMGLIDVREPMPAEAGSAYGLERYWSRNWAGNVEVSRAQRVCPS